MDWLCWVRKDTTEVAMNERRVDLKMVRELHVRGPIQRPVERENVKYWMM